MVSKNFRILLLVLFSACAHGDGPRIDVYAHDPDNKGFVWVDPKGKEDFVTYEQSKPLKLQAFQPKGIKAVIDYYKAQVQFWKTKAEQCQN